jgi:hypothetical protein
MTTTLNKTYNYIIGFSYQREEDGEPCDFISSVPSRILDWQVREVEKYIKENEYFRGTRDFSIDEDLWEPYLNTSIAHYGIDTSGWENITWEYTSKIDKRTNEYRSVA